MHSFDYFSFSRAESWYYFQTAQNFFRAAQIDLKVHILCRTKR